MDSVSQLVLGAALGEVTLGRSIGRRAMLVGAILGTLPDLDVLVFYADAVDNFTRHRSFSHSLFVLTLISPFTALVLQRVVRSDVSFIRWWLMTWSVLVTHPLLDSFTVYGTQIWWPLPVNPVAWGSMFIIDPVYTLPLILGLVLFWRVGSSRGYFWNSVGLALSTAYLCWSLVAQQHAREVAQAALNNQGIEVSKLLVAPFPLSLLWRYVAIDEQNYYEAYYSLLDNTREIRFVAQSRGRELLESMQTHEPVARLDWFTGSLIAANRRGDELIVSDLRMGIEANYVFEFGVAQWVDNRWQATRSYLLPLQVDRQRVLDVWRRIWDENVIIESS